MSRTPENLRNIVLMGHSDSGKTSLVEAMLHKAGAIGRLGNIQAGTTTCDYDTAEKEKQHSIFLKTAHLTWEGVEVNLIDTPGRPDFFADQICGALAGDVACIVINARTGIGINTRKAWKVATELGLAKMIVINKLDSDNVELEPLIQRIRDAFGTGCVMFRTPDQTGPDYSKNADAMQDDTVREQITEAAVETNEALMEKYLEEGEISPEELRKGIASGIRAGVMVPMVTASATKEVGIDDVLNVIKEYMPSPAAAVKRKDTEGQEIALDGPFVAQVFKVIMGDYGQLSYLRVLGGTTDGHNGLVNLETGKSERVGEFQRTQGKSLAGAGAAVAGDVVVVPKIDTFDIGDTITDGKHESKLPRPAMPKPMVGLAVSPKSRADETKMRPALDRMEREDLTFVTERHEETHELVIMGMSALHLETTLLRMKDRSKVEVETHLPKIAYRETIRGKAESRYRHKKQSGGSGEFGEVAIRLMPSERGAGFVFKNVVVGGAISAAYVPAVQKGIQESMEEGVVAGYRFVDATVELWDGKEHPVDSKEVAFKKAGRGAFREAVEKAKPVLLEPIMEVEITVPDSFTGDIMGDLARRRSQPQGMDQTEEGTVIKALVPEAELQTYSQDLRSMTSGEGVYEMKLAHYEFLPPDKAQPLIDAHQKSREAEK
ncbi:MAG: elongation factor G [Planctomycetota bacterium]